MTLKVTIDNQQALLLSELAAVYSVTTAGCSIECKSSITEAHLSLHPRMARSVKTARMPSYYSGDASEIIKKKAILMLFRLFLKISPPQSTVGRYNSHFCW